MLMAASISGDAWTLGVGVHTTGQQNLEAGRLPCQLALRGRSMFPGWTQLLHNDKLLVLHSPGDGGAEVTFLTSGLSGEAQ